MNTAQQKTRENSAVPEIQTSTDQGFLKALAEAIIESREEAQRLEKTRQIDPKVMHRYFTL